MPVVAGLVGRLAVAGLAAEPAVAVVEHSVGYVATAVAAAVFVLVPVACGCGSLAQSVLAAAVGVEVELQALPESPS